MDDCSAHGFCVAFKKKKEQTPAKFTQVLLVSIQHQKNALFPCVNLEHEFNVLGFEVEVALLGNLVEI